MNAETFFQSFDKSLWASALILLKEDNNVLEITRPDKELELSQSISLVEMVSWNNFSDQIFDQELENL